jgi:hypothetical protein
VEPQQPVTPRRRRSGSEKRKRPTPFPVRLSPEERAAIAADAERAGLTLGSFIRSRVLAAPTTRARKQVPVDYAALAAALRAFTKAAVNINQIARHLNTFGFPIPEDLAAVASRLDASRREVMAAMGRG